MDQAFAQMGSKATWEPHIVSIFCDVCIKEIAEGSRPGTHFTKDGWKRVVATFQKESGRPYDRKVLKNKWDLLKKDYTQWLELIGHETDLGWDANKQTIDASDDWWNKKILEFPHAKKFRQHGIGPELYNKLSTMFSTVVATSSSAWTPSSGRIPNESKKFVSVNEDSQDDGEKFVDVNEDSEDDGIHINVEDTQNKKRKTSASKMGESKPGGVVHLSHQIHCIVEIAENSTVRQSTKSEDSNYSIRKVMQLLNGIKDIPYTSELYLFATRLFMKKEKREMFIVLPNNDARRIWLDNELAMMEKD